MTILLRPVAPMMDRGQRFVLYGVAWPDYEKIVDALCEQHVRTTYDRGTLELMSPLPIHERYERTLGLLFGVLSQELGIRIMGLGSTTFRSPAAQRGLEPDECFYLASAARVRSWDVIDLEIDPPPDLALEVEISRSALDRMAIYASLGVPEVWRFDGKTLKPFSLVKSGKYRSAAVSPSMPFLPLREVPPIIHRLGVLGDEGAWLGEARDWVRTRVAPLKEAAGRRRPRPGR
jgi:Uma2 family endonuclease